MITNPERPNRVTKNEKMLMGLKAEDEYEQIKVDAMMDSQAYDTMCGIELVGGSEIKDTQRYENWNVLQWVEWIGKQSQSSAGNRPKGRMRQETSRRSCRMRVNSRCASAV